MTERKEMRNLVNRGEKKPLVLVCIDLISAWGELMSL